jgi:putative transposase
VKWALVELVIRLAKRGGRPRTVNMREVLSASLSVLWTGCRWKALPTRSTVREYLGPWQSDGAGLSGISCGAAG